MIRFFGKRRYARQMADAMKINGIPPDLVNAFTQHPFFTLAVATGYETGMDPARNAYMMLQTMKQMEEELEAAANKALEAAQ